MRVLVFVTAFLWLASAAAASPQLTVLGGEQQVEVTGAQPGARYVLTHDGRVVALILINFRSPMARSMAWPTCSGDCSTVEPVSPRKSCVPLLPISWLV